MISLRTLATQLVEFRRRPSPILTHSELVQTIGLDGIREAVARRWLIPSESGHLAVSHYGTHIDGFTQMAEADVNSKDELQVGDPVVVADEGQPYAGVIAKKDNTGYYVSFGKRKPAKERTWRREEISKTKPGERSVALTPYPQDVLNPTPSSNTPAPGRETTPLP